MTPQDIMDRIKEDTGLEINKSHILYYDEVGLVSPLRTEAGVREYSEEDLVDLTIAVLLSDLGTGIEDIKKLLREHDFSVLKDIDSRIEMLFKKGRERI